ncbi:MULTISPECIES: site-2 protease family protein [Pirellulaceae]|uniref:Regulator of sigma E protease n=1 Tax=Aporhodopirellula rubra TaxID=980271 RepID=A0A7W5H9D4_9BACT|nr:MULTISPECIES: site-2 protease family protein [Pirellulaceae]EMI47131.1 metalloproteinase [Rhodopirellula sp. SWK7]MBB3210294.1 regulator of sigma E protease [Aporhodopirellula rubra]
MSLLSDFSLFASLLAATDEPGFLASLLSGTWLWTKVLVGIGLVIFVHELGHFLAAKLFGVKCEKFYVGFDVPLQLGPIKFPRTLGKFTYGETEYGIGIIPLGGYVKMLGQDDDPRKAEEEAKRIREGGEDGEPGKLDPRSYPAKTVWQRMVIISAGVVMNVITGILFAAIAYFYGVPYTPAIVGGVTPGGAAWTAGVQPGGLVTSIANSEDDDQMHFTKMQTAIMTEGMDKPDQPILVRFSYGKESREYSLMPQPHPLEPSLRMIGIHGPISGNLLRSIYAMPGSSAAEVLTDGDAGAQVIGWNGTPVDRESMMPIAPLLNEIYSQPSEPISLTLLRADGTENTVNLAPQSEKDFGIRFRIGKITSLIKDGPAEVAGFEVGDQIVAVNGDESIDAYTLLLRSWPAGEDVEFTVQRGSGDSAETKTITVTPNEGFQTKPPVSELGETMASTPLGLAYNPTTIVESVTQSDSPLQAGDEVKEVRIRFPDQAARDALARQLGEATMTKLTEGWELGATMPLGILMETVQVLPVDSEVLVKATRPPEGSVIEATLKVQTSGRNWYERGLNFSDVEQIQTADSFGNALALGLREGIRGLENVGRFLGMLVSGKVQAKFLGGPIRIAQMASYEAERGISAQLLFLTMLSMNLAILNFLPIPALDGGHMLFLIAEAIRGKKLDEALEMRLTFAGVLALLALMIFVFANDILHL